MNGYFRLVIAQNGTGMQLFPATDGGNPIDINEIASYLQLKRIADYDIKLLYAAIQNLKQEPVTVPICATPVYQEQETMFLTVSEDKMTVTARFIAPSNQGSRMSKEDIIKDLAFRRIKAGVSPEAIEAFVANPQYSTDIVLAHGKAPRHGTDASIEYFFNTDLQNKPTRNEDGSVDFFNLNNINHCKAGDLLAKLTPEDKGDPGMNVYGEVIRPRDVKKLMLKFGRNITLSEDRLEIRSDINGHVMLAGDKVFVSDVYEVENVGTATGNITSEGSVLVSGNVQTGFSIQATGNVEVRGVVEGATIEAGGDIIIARGVNGMSRAVLKAGGCIISKFIENATVEAGTYVESDTIMHSRVSAKTDVTVDGKKGFIAGGIVRATNKVSCRTLGSPMGADTVVEVGVDPELKARHVQIQKDMMESQKKLTMIKTTVNGAAVKLKQGVQLPPDQMKYIQSLMQASKQLEEQLMESAQELDKLDEILAGKDDACVCVRDTAYGGTKIVMGEDSLVLKADAKFCKFMDVRGEIKATSL